MKICPNQFEGTPYLCGIPSYHANCAMRVGEGIAVVSYDGVAYVVSLEWNEPTKIPGSSLTYADLKRYALERLPKQPALPREEVF